MNMIKKLSRRGAGGAAGSYRDLDKAPVQRYVDIQQARGRLISIGNVDVDVEHVVERTFLCDRHRCIQWTPHEKKKDAKPLIDHSCCSRYTVPVTDLDRDSSPRSCRWCASGSRRAIRSSSTRRSRPTRSQEDFSFVMREQESGACQFVLYEEGLTSCAIHKTCLEEGLDPWVYKPLGCSLWPLALVDYDDDGETATCSRSTRARPPGIFDDEPDDDQQTRRTSPAWSIKDPTYDPIYSS